MEKTNISRKVGALTESVIREMTNLCEKYKGINLAQGAPDFPAPEAVKKAAVEAILSDHNQYTQTWGIRELRDRVAVKLRKYNGIIADPKSEITITCGSSEAVACSIFATVEQGDEVIILEPFYENYGPDTVLAGGKPRYVALEPPDFRLNEERLKKAFNSKTKAIVVNTPNNPTGRVFDEADLELIADLCRDFNSLVITDEVYEYIIYDGRRHISMAALEDMQERTITVCSLSKTYSVTGWRLGYVAATKEISKAIRKVHEFLTVTPPAPLQVGAIAALNMPKSYYDSLRKTYEVKRNLMLRILKKVGFHCFKPEGAYYVWANFSDFYAGTDFEFARRMVKEVGVAGVPGSSFYSGADGRDRIRFTYSKTDSTLKEAGERLKELKELAPRWRAS